MKSECYQSFRMLCRLEVFIQKQIIQFPFLQELHSFPVHECSQFLFGFLQGSSCHISFYHSLLAPAEFSHALSLISLSFFAAVCCLPCCKLLLCGLFGRSQRAGPVAKVPPKRLAASKDCVSFVCIYTTPQMLKQTLTPNQLICEVSPDENKRSMMETLPERLQNVSLVFIITHSFSSALV